ncbi:MAG: TRAP transporter substrate-binding protein [Brotaphodocola sp.]
MNKIIKRLSFLGIIVLLIFTIFSMSKIHRMQSEQTSDDSTFQSKDNFQEPLVRDGKVLLRLANNQGPEHPVSKACDYFAELVRNRTDGRIEILNYHSGQLGDEKAVVPQVVYGGIDLARVSVAMLSDYEPGLVVFQMPYLYENAEHMWKVLDSEIGDEYLRKLRDSGVEGLCWYDAGARNFYTTERQIEHVDDLKGLKIRIQESPYISDLIRMLGAEPVELPYHKVGMALKYGEVDGAENNFSSYIGMGHYLYAKNIVADEHIRLPEMLIMNQIVLEQLSQEDQQIIRQAARESSLWQRRLWEEEEEKSIKTLEQAGVRVTRLKDKQEFMDRVQPIYDTYGKGYESLFRRIQELRSE